MPFGCVTVPGSGGENSPCVHCPGCTFPNRKNAAYDGSYQALDYPNGDIAIEGGVCTDVVIRALRTGMKLDLQKLVHEDMKAVVD